MGNTGVRTMPRVKLQQSKYDKLAALIWGYAASKEVGTVELAKMIGVTPKTLSARKKSPETFKLDELSRAMHKLGIPIDDLRAAIPY
jgi:hypothetical protein